ncbi:heavy metal translocating P-type ATPase [Vagococcus vulneris]|uniref:Heavy metal translocating P-type ATPase n=1 Tax=Vagococcus vulneris TaxID=1977869 RepID=A0A430A167_9ENTE|nr:heavy metal translocating P-type ATPase [Vagococcus vulneris]RSU00138.1 heavy metal translocating P-type ATPase [Vagococcus vulneris]
MTKIKQLPVSMWTTIICGVMMIIGYIIQQQQISWYPIIFISGMLIGGFEQTKDGILDTIEDRHLNVDLLMALAAIGACLIQYYFEGIMLTFIFSLSGALEEMTTNQSKKEIEALIKIQPETAIKVNETGETIEVPVQDLAIGDIVLVPKGANVPIDGDLITNFATIDEASITGESIPVDKQMNDAIFGGTINAGHAFQMIVTKISNDTLFSKIIKLVEEAQNTPSQTASFLSRFENVYVKVILIIVPLAIILPYFLLSWSFEESFYRGMVLLVVASPCALVASATPATLAAISNGARNGILFKGGIYLESLADIKAITFDKTGTLTNGTPQVTDDCFINNPKEDTLNMLITLESNSTHPLAAAILNHYPTNQSYDSKILVEEIDGCGMQATDNDDVWRVGKPAFVTTQPVSHDILTQQNKWQTEGKTVIFISKNDTIVGYLALLDLPKDGALETIDYFNKSGVVTTMLTGDNEKTAHAIAKSLHLDNVVAGCLPEDKTTFIKQQKNNLGENIMVGDGINDAPALANASIGVAMGQGTDVAIDIADVVLIKNSLIRLSYSHKLSKKLKRIVKQNIAFSFTVIACLIISNFAGIVNLPLGVIGHEGSTILVILNGLRMLQTIK